jgi:hypothetical protein
MNVLARAGQMTSDHWYPLVLVGAVATLTIMARAKDRPHRTPYFKVALPLLLSAVLFLALSLPYLIVGIQRT